MRGAIVVSRHACERYAEHDPGADGQAVADACRFGSPLTPEVVAAVTSNPRRATNGDLYRLAENGRGIFVVQPHHTRPGAWFVITYLRLQRSQVEILRRAA